MSDHEPEKPTDDGEDPADEPHMDDGEEDDGAGPDPDEA